jgi:hypothetical protein
MSYKIARKVAPSACLCSASSSGAGNVIFSFVGGDFMPSISSSTINLLAGYEYLIMSYPSPATNATCSYYTIVNGINGTAVTTNTATFDSGRDTTFNSILAVTDVTFSLYASSALSSNTRLEIWRHPL